MQRTCVQLRYDILGVSICTIIYFSSITTTVVSILYGWEYGIFVSGTSPSVKVNLLCSGI